MNPFGSYKKLLGNSVSAMAAAIEIYNKPNFSYRDETFVVLLVNAWELALKALLSKNKKGVFYKKKRNEPYRTFSIKDAINKCEALFPLSIDFLAVQGNLEKLISYRDNIIHFYNNEGIRVIVYALAQTAIVNYSDLLKDKLGKNLSEEITITLLPLSISAPVDPIEFLNATPSSSKESPATKEFNQNLRELVVEVEERGGDTGRLLTIFTVSLQSTKKIASSDFVVGVDGQSNNTKRVLVTQKLDPNKSHPLRQKDIVVSVKNKKHGLVNKVGDRPLTTHVFQKIVKYYKIKDESKYCWQDDTGTITRYSREVITFLRSLSASDVNDAMNV